MAIINILFTVDILCAKACSTVCLIVMVLTVDQLHIVCVTSCSHILTNGHSEPNFSHCLHCITHMVSTSQSQWQTLWRFIKSCVICICAFCSLLMLQNQTQFYALLALGVLTCTYCTAFKCSEPWKLRRRWRASEIPNSPPQKNQGYLRNLKSSYKFSLWILLWG